MNGFEAYSLYQAIKLHFSSKSYNFFIYEGKTRVTLESFEKRRDKWQFHKLARKYDEQEFIKFLVANFRKNEKTWTMDLLKEQAETNFREWKRITESMSYTYKEELSKHCSTPKEFGSLFVPVNGQLPKILTLMMQEEVSLETVVILNNILRLVENWDKKISDDVIYPKLSLKIRKYGAFLTVDVDKYRALTKGLIG